jgi:hypothetical protein
MCSLLSSLCQGHHRRRQHRPCHVRTSNKGRKHDLSWSLMEDGRSARLRHCTGHVHASILFCWHTQTGTHHTIRAASPTTIAAPQPPYSASHPRDRPGWGTYESARPLLLRPSSTKFSVSNNAARRSKRPACSARQRKRVQELAAASRAAAHYDGICLARWRRISGGRFCMRCPSPGDSSLSLSNMGRDSKAATCLSHLACLGMGVQPDSPRSRPLRRELYCGYVCVCCAKYSDMRSLRVAVLEILPKHLPGPSNRHGPYMPQAEEAVANERILLETAQRSRNIRR